MTSVLFHIKCMYWCRSNLLFTIQRRGCWLLPVFLPITTVTQWPMLALQSRITDVCSFHVHWISLSVLWFNIEFIVILIMCFAKVFSVGTEGIYPSIFCESRQIINTVLWRLARSHRSLDNSFHRWHILLFVPFLRKKCVFWRIWSKAIGFVVIRVIQCNMLTISSIPTMVIYVHVLNYAHRLL